MIQVEVRHSPAKDHRNENSGTFFFVHFFLASSPSLSASPWLENEEKPCEGERGAARLADVLWEKVISMDFKSIFECGQSTLNGAQGS